MLKLPDMHNVTKERSLLSENCNLSSFMALLHLSLISLSVVAKNFFTASEKNMHFHFNCTVIRICKELVTVLLFNKNAL